MIDCTLCTQKESCPLYPKATLHNSNIATVDIADLEDATYEACSFYVCKQLGIPAAVRAINDYLAHLSLNIKKIDYKGEVIPVLSFGSMEKPRGKWGRFVETAKPHRIFALHPDKKEEVWLQLSPRVSRLICRELYGTEC